ncbi:septation protein IspZ [Aeromonas hydrophila]|uniref:septation protein IspZ n=1 Tax=Aeromonas hydrophila TaxID=644 RepID=UPI0039779960
MIKNIWGLFWRTYSYVFIVSSLLSFVWFFLFLPEIWIVIRTSVFYMVMGGGLLIPFNKRRGVLFYMWGRRLAITDTVWCNYRRVAGWSYIVYSVMLHVVFELLPVTYWVSIKTYGGIFMMYVLPISVSMTLISKKS